MAESRFYDFDPSPVAAILATLLFGASAIFHTVQLFRARGSRFFIPFLVGAYLMTVGYILRIISASQPDNLMAYVCQNLFVVLSPTLYTAAVYRTYSHILTYTSKPHLSLMGQRRGSRVFISGSIFAFILQLLGCAIQTLLRLGQCGYGWSGDGKWRKLLHILLLASVFIIVRCAFWSAEFAQGTDGYPFSDEIYFYLYDAVPIFIVQVVFHFYQPGRILGTKTNTCSNVIALKVIPPVQ
ncbi:RTA1 like protein-domain-containing protein [Aspergillus stella-maris]|uniref:RTA1 like protein-domain-containing protein n=1 Tax=Aspergillus stella-maris TaxID=1810926 RepID=UPI003CCC936C